MTKIYRLFSFVPVALVASSILLSGCSHDNGSDDTGPTPSQLVQADIQAMSGSHTASVQTFDADYRGTFTAIFGGQTGADLKNYLFTRVHRFYTPEQLSTFHSQPGDFVHKAWRTDGNTQDDVLASRQIVLGAANIGTILWLSGLVDGVQMTIEDGSDTFTVDSSRVGIMMIGPGYKASLPSVYRQGILLHEARHSDCTGGITQADLEVLRNSSSAQETDQRFKDRACGHLHTYCPAGSDFENFQACDDLPWGAYAVEYVFLLANYSSTPEFSDARANMDAALVDMRSRLLFDADDMMRGQMGAPDMSSSGLRP